MQDGPVEETRGSDFQHGAAIVSDGLRCTGLGVVEILLRVPAPSLRRAGKDRFSAGPQEAHVKALLIARALLQFDGPLQRRQSAELVTGRVLAQRRVNDVVIALRERGREKRIRESRERDDADDENGRIPQREPETERATHGHDGARST